MLNIDDTLAELAKRQASLTALGGQSTTVGVATRTAADAVRVAGTRAAAAARELAADDAQVTEALKARTAALATLDAATTQGTPPPLSDAAALALKTAVEGANVITEAVLQDPGLKAVHDLDTKIDGLLNATLTDLTGKQSALAAAQTDLDTKRGVALARLAAVQARAAQISVWLATAQTKRALALQLVATSDKVSHRAAIVAYADYMSARTKLTTEAIPATGTNLKDDWSGATGVMGPWNDAVVNLAKAEEDLAVAQLAYDTKLAEQVAARQTRDADAAAAVLMAIP